MSLLQTVNNANVLPVILTSGNIQGIPVQYDSGNTNGDYGSYDEGGFDNSVGTVHINGADSGLYLAKSYILGTVSNIGQVTISAGNLLNQSNIWYSPGISSITNGIPLVNSTTVQATFLKASRAV